MLVIKLNTVLIRYDSVFKRLSAPVPSKRNAVESVVKKKKEEEEAPCLLHLISRALFVWLIIMIGKVPLIPVRLLFYNVLWMEFLAATWTHLHLCKHFVIVCFMINKLGFTHSIWLSSPFLDDECSLFLIFFVFFFFIFLLASIRGS